MRYRYNKDKSVQLLSERGVSFKEIAQAIDNGNIVRIGEHHNKERYPNQKIMYVELLEKIYVVPYIKEADGSLFLKTIYHSSKIQKLLSNDQASRITKAAHLLSSGNIVAFPTETVYGLGADATSDEACAKIYQLKGRASNNPLIVHVPSIEEAREIAVFNQQAETLATKFWPGPLTFVLPLKRDAKISKIVTAGLNTIAIRIPSHEIALELIRATGKPIAAPSANPSGYVSPTTTNHVLSNFPDLYVIEGSNSEYGLESTIIDLTGKPTILRYGFITPESLSKALCEEVVYNHGYEYIKAPGMMAKHYSPRAHVRLNATELQDGEMGIGFGEIDFDLNLSKAGDLVEAAANLFDMLQKLDKQTKAIAIGPIPDKGIGLAINDRLRRAGA